MEGMAGIDEGLYVEEDAVLAETQNPRIRSGMREVPLRVSMQCSKERRL